MNKKGHEMRGRNFRNLVVAGWWVMVLGACGSILGQTAEKAPASALSLEAIAIEPTAPTADTLCQLRVRVKNAAKKTISALDFGVSIGGQPLKVYEQQLFLEPVEPGATAEIRLYNFWTSETGRPAPKGGQLEVEVTLREAQWVTVTTEEDGTEVWTLGEKVPGLPVSRSLKVKLKK